MHAIPRRSIAFDTLVLECTRRCPARCDYCCTAMGRRRGALLDFPRAAEWARLLLRAVPEIDGLALCGGEPFTRYRSVLQFLAEVRDFSFTRRSIITNAYWAHSVEQVVHRMDTLKQLGITCVNVSCDPTHQAFIPLQRVKNLLRGCVQAGVPRIAVIGTFYEEASPRSFFHDCPDLLERAEITFSARPVAPAGAALHQQHRIRWREPPHPAPVCPEISTLMVTALGEVAPCCSVLRRDPQLLFGSIHESPPGEVVARMQGSFYLHMITSFGFLELESALRKLVPGYRLPSSYTSACDLCGQVVEEISMRPTLASALRRCEHLYVSAHVAQIVNPGRGPADGAVGV